VLSVVGTTEIWSAQRVGDRNLESAKGASETRQLAIFPLSDNYSRLGAWPHTRRAETKWRTRSEAESCAGGLPTDDRAKGESQRERETGFLTRWSASGSRVIYPVWGCHWLMAL